MRIGIDLGGTKIEVAAINNDHKVVFNKRVPTPQGDYQHTLKVIISLIKEAEQFIGQTASVGVGTPGSVSPLTGRMRNSNSTCLNHQPLLEDIEAYLSRPIKLANDANCFALSEAVDGVAADAHVVFGAILGTGVGGGVVVGQQLISGANGIAGEWGHSPMPSLDIEPKLLDRQCYCGKTDCIETFLSGPGFAETYLRKTGLQLLPQEIIKKSDGGDQYAQEAFTAYQKQLAAALSQIINLLDPDVIVLGGGMSKVHQLYAGVTSFWGEYIFSDTISTILAPPQYGDASGVRGAAWLWDAP